MPIHQTTYNEEKKKMPDRFIGAYLTICINVFINNKFIILYLYMKLQEMHIFK